MTLAPTPGAPGQSDPHAIAASSAHPPLPAGSRYQMVVSNPGSIEAESIRALRTRIIAQHVRENRRALAICTPSSRSGCSFIASNLGAAISQVGVKTILVDANLRRPVLGEAFGFAANVPGVSDYLRGDASLDEVIHETALPDLSIIPAGTPAANPQELISGERFRLLVNQLLREFELSLYDTPPSSTCTDAQRVATVAGYSLIVARTDKTYVEDVKTLAGLLRADRSNIIGCVATEFDE